jgi:hypothetical protein
VRRVLIIAGSIILISVTSYSQSIIQPNYGLKSHETLEINKIELTSGTTVFNLSVENRIQNGNFCADKNIFIIYPDGTRIKMISSNGIPVCPQIHRFKEPGEKLTFALTFPALKQDTYWIDLVEECSENCFSFYGITLDNDLNMRLEKIFSLASSRTPDENISQFKSILDSIDSRDLGIEGLLYINIINAAIENNDKVNAIVWYKRLSTSNAPRFGSYLKYLNDKGIKY